MKTRKYFLAHTDGDTYELIGNGKAAQIENGARTGRIETTNILLNSGYKYKWINT